MHPLLVPFISLTTGELCRLLASNPLPQLITMFGNVGLNEHKKMPTV